MTQQTVDCLSTFLNARPKRVPKGARLKAITFDWLSICLTRLADSDNIRAVNTGPKTNKELRFLVTP